MKVAACRKPDRAWFFVECGMSVFKILAILPDLNGWVQHFPVSAADPATEKSLGLSGFTALPLLQFDDYGLVDIFFIPATYHAVNTSGAEGELVFEKDAMIPQGCQIEDVLHRSKGVSPGGDFCG
jgi:hypothetical protein